MIGASTRSARNAALRSARISSRTTARVQSQSSRLPLRQPAAALHTLPSARAGCRRSMTPAVSALPSPVLGDDRARPMSSLAEPTLFPAISADDNNDGEALLRSDVRTMGALLGDAISQHHGPEVFEKIEALRSMAKASRMSAETDVDGSRLGPMVDFVAGLSEQELVVISRAFAHFLGIANAAEAHQRCRRLNQDSKSEGAAGHLGALHETKRDSTAGVLAGFLDGGDGSVSRDDLYESLCTQCVEIVLTAHPTQVNRRTLLEKHGRVQSVLTEADRIRESGTPYERKELDDALRREIASIWQTDEVSRVKPSPQSEAERGTLVLETVLWEVLPNFLRKLDATMRERMGEEYGLPLKASPFKFASWMGGDRDGNPNVVADVTREVTLTNRLKAAELFEKDVRELMSLISGNPPRGMDGQCTFESEAMDKVRARSG